MMFNGWAFKDVARNVVILYKEPVNCLTYNPECTWTGDYEYRISYIGYLLGVSVAATLAIFLFNQIFEFVVHCTAERRAAQCSCGNPHDGSSCIHAATAVKKDRAKSSLGDELV